MDITTYDIIAPVSDKTKPRFFSKINSLVFRLDKKYKYYVEVSRYNKEEDIYSYFLLLSNYNFNINCRKINNDNYGRTIIILHNNLLEYIKAESKSRGNINIDYIESTNEYDVYSVE